MRRIVLSTSTSCLDYLTNKPKNIRMIPMHIEFDGQMFLDGKNITLEEMTNIMNANPDILPHTSPPTEDEIAEIFYELLHAGYEEVFIVCMSSRLSDTYARIKSIKGLFASKMDIYLFDSGQLSYPEGLMALEAARLMNADYSMDRVAYYLQRMRANTKVWFVIDDLRNIIRTKRISAPAGFIANLLDIKPVLKFNDNGEVVPHARIRKIEKALEHICHIALDTIKNQKAQLYVLTPGDNDLSQYLVAYLASCGLSNVQIKPIATVTVANLGTRGVGISVLLEN